LRTRDPCHERRTETESRLCPFDGRRHHRPHFLSLLALNLGFSQEFLSTWLRSWGVGYVIVIPAILLIGPRLQARIDRFIV
jgi:hypothetical protein